MDRLEADRRRRDGSATPKRCSAGRYQWLKSGEGGAQRGGVDRRAGPSQHQDDDTSRRRPGRQRAPSSDANQPRAVGRILVAAIRSQHSWVTGWFPDAPSDQLGRLIAGYPAGYPSQVMRDPLDALKGTVTQIHGRAGQKHLEVPRRLPRRRDHLAAARALPSLSHAGWIPELAALLTPRHDYPSDRRQRGPATATRLATE